LTGAIKDEKVPSDKISGEGREGEEWPPNKPCNLEVGKKESRSVFSGEGEEKGSSSYQ